MTVPDGSLFDASDANWAALEGFARACPSVTVDAFMWMGALDLDTGRRVDMYQHVDTRRYLHLDAAGHAQEAVTRSSFTVHRTAADAVSHLELGLASRRSNRRQRTLA